MSEIEFKYDMPLEETMLFEDIYHPGLQSSVEEKQLLRDAPGSIFVWMLVDGILAGEAYGKPPCDSRVIAAYPSLTPRDGVHCWSQTIIPGFQGRGFGRKLKEHWLAIAKHMGYKLVSGIARPGASQALNAQFGAVFVAASPIGATPARSIRSTRWL